MSPAEAPFVYAFSALLACGAVVLLFLPLLRHIWLFSASRIVYVAVIASMLGLSAAAVFLVTFAISDPAYFLPIAAITVGLRLGSPSLLYRRVRERFDVRRAWSVIRILFGLACFAFAVVLLYDLSQILAGQEPPLFAMLSEQLAMAVSASALIVRGALRVRLHETKDLWPIWTAATLFAIAFVLVAPYAFPAFAAAYVVSGFVGWILGAFVVRFLD